ncbi:hypothetical protein GW17_00036410 [Ensete ventricosum]|nr:hypothetical protein GW17_00036410 [Ensete ventricosum]
MRLVLQDFIYEDELNNFVETGVISELIVAFSREGQIKEYVQHKMTEKVRYTSAILFSYHFGVSSSFLIIVSPNFLYVILLQGSLDSSETESLVKNLQTEGRYLRDVW